MAADIIIPEDIETGGHWNHRLMVEQTDEEVYFSIHEVHYDMNGKLKGYTEKPVSVTSESLEGVKWVLDKMAECLQKPILWSGDKWPQEYNTPITD